MKSMPKLRINEHRIIDKFMPYDPNNIKLSAEMLGLVYRMFQSSRITSVKGIKKALSNYETNQNELIIDFKKTCPHITQNEVNDFFNI